MPNLALAPTFKIVDRRTILDRVLSALLADDECRYVFRGESRCSDDQLANWEARNTIVTLMREFPLQPESSSTSNSKPENEPTDLK